MADEEDDDGTAPKDKPERIGLSPRDVTLRYLKQLASLGIYGKSPTQVAARLVDEGIRRAIVDGLIDKQQDL